MRAALEYLVAYFVGVGLSLSAIWLMASFVGMGWSNPFSVGADWQIARVLSLWMGLLSPFALWIRRELP